MLCEISQLQIKPRGMYFVPNITIDKFCLAIIFIFILCVILSKLFEVLLIRKMLSNLDDITMLTKVTSKGSLRKFYNKYAYTFICEFSGKFIVVIVLKDTFLFGNRLVCNKPIVLEYANNIVNSVLRDTGVLCIPLILMEHHTLEFVLNSCKSERQYYACNFRNLTRVLPDVLDDSVELDIMKVREFYGYLSDSPSLTERKGLPKCQ